MMITIAITEAKIGPYDLQDFNIYYITRYGFPPSKVAFLALHAWSDRRRGAWPPGTPEERRRDYDLPTIKRWLEVFLYRFFQISQFKRSCVPNGPGIISMGSTSVFHGGLPAARKDDMTAHAGCVAPIPAPTGKVIAPCSDDVIING